MFLSTDADVLVMASSIKLEYPLNDALPSVEHTRDRLLAKIFGFRKEEKSGIITSDQDFALLYSYGMVLPPLPHSPTSANDAFV